MITNHEANARREVAYYADALTQVQLQVKGIEQRLAAAKLIVAEADESRAAAVLEDESDVENA